MNPTKTTVGSLMAAMVFQIENKSKHESNKKPKPRMPANLARMSSCGSIRTLNSEVASLKQNPRDAFMDELDGMCKQLQIDNAVNETSIDADHASVASERKVNPVLKASPY